MFACRFPSEINAQKKENRNELGLTVYPVTLQNMFGYTYTVLVAPAPANIDCTDYYCKIAVVQFMHDAL